MAQKKIEFSKDAEAVIDQIIELARINTEESFEEIDEILSQYDKYDLVTIITEFNPTIPRKRYATKLPSQVMADINLLAIAEVEKSESL